MLAHVAPNWLQVGPKLARVGSSWLQVGPREPKLLECWLKGFAHNNDAGNQSNLAVLRRLCLLGLAFPQCSRRLCLLGLGFQGFHDCSEEQVHRLAVILRSRFMFSLSCHQGVSCWYFFQVAKHECLSKIFLSNVPFRCFLLVVLS